MNLAIGAIFRNEFNYIVEWLAWHQVAGFEEFYIADNGSDDGTRALLEALSDLGFIKLIYQPVVKQNAQIKAYNRIMQKAINFIDAILFIDADEFLTHDSMIDGAEYEYMCALVNDESIGMVGINWRCFGSSGLVDFDNRPVIERFNMAASDEKMSPNQFLKSISKIPYVKNINPHSAFCPSKKYIKVDGEEVKDFILNKDGEFVNVPHSGRTNSVTISPLRVNHYVVKSKAEFLQKRARGDAMRGVDFDRGEFYFNYHDFKDVKISFPESKINSLKKRMYYIYSSLDFSIFYKKIKGVIDDNNRDLIRGWLVDESKSSKNLSIVIFVNGYFQDRVFCGFYRNDLKEKNISRNGLSEFRFTHSKTLVSGDIVEVTVFGNNYVFPDKACVVIK